MQNMSIETIIVIIAAVVVVAVLLIVFLSRIGRLNRSLEEKRGELAGKDMQIQGLAKDLEHKAAEAENR